MNAFSLFKKTKIRLVVSDFVTAACLTFSTVDFVFPPKGGGEICVFFSRHTKYSRYSLISKGKMGHVSHFLPIKFIQSNSFDLWEVLNLLFFPLWRVTLFIFLFWGTESWTDGFYLSFLCNKRVLGSFSPLTTVGLQESHHAWCQVVVIPVHPAQSL